MNNDVCWIDTVDHDDASAELRDAYDAVHGPGGTVDNLYRAYSLRPHMMVPADDLYRAVLHHPDNRLPAWLSELIATYVAILTGCDYAFTHHSHNFRCLFGAEERAKRILLSLRGDHALHDCSEKEISTLTFTRKLTLQPGDMNMQDTAALRQAGWDDGEILEIVQIAASFSYSARVINGLGITLGNEKIGFYQPARPGRLARLLTPDQRR